MITPREQEIALGVMTQTLHQIAEMLLATAAVEPADCPECKPSVALTLAADIIMARAAELTNRFERPSSAPAVMASNSFIAAPGVRWTQLSRHPESSLPRAAFRRMTFLDFIKLLPLVFAACCVVMLVRRIV